MVRFGLIGYGAWGQHHANAILEEPGAELTFVVTTSRSADGNSPLGEVPFYDSFQAALRGHDVDVIDVVVPNHLHAKYAIEALGRGLHVLLEKPLATNLLDATNIVNAWEAAGTVLYVGYELRLSKLWNQTRDIVKRGDIGEVRWVDLSLERHPFRQGRQGWRFDAKSVGNWMIEEAVHHLDLMTWLADKAGEVKEVHTTFPGAGGPMAELCATSLRFDTGLFGTYRYALNAEGHHLVATLYGDEGSVRTEWHGVTDRTLHPTTSIAIRKSGTSTAVYPGEDSGELFELRAEIAKMVRCVMHAEEPPMSPYEALRNLQIALQIQAAGEVHGAVNGG